MVWPWAVYVFIISSFVCSDFAYLDAEFASMLTFVRLNANVGGTLLFMLRPFCEKILVFERDTKPGSYLVRWPFITQ